MMYVFKKLSKDDIVKLLPINLDDFIDDKQLESMNIYDAKKNTDLWEKLKVNETFWWISTIGESKIYHFITPDNEISVMLLHEINMITYNKYEHWVGALCEEDERRVLNIEKAKENELKALFVVYNPMSVNGNTSLSKLRHHYYKSITTAINDLNIHCDIPNKYELKANLVESSTGINLTISTTSVNDTTVNLGINLSNKDSVKEVIQTMVHVRFNGDAKKIRESLINALNGLHTVLCKQDAILNA